MQYRALYDWIDDLKNIETPKDAPLKHSLLFEVADDLKIRVNRKALEFFGQVYEVQELIYNPNSRHFQIDFVLENDVIIDQFQSFVLRTLTPYFALVELIQNKELKELCLKDLSNFFITQVKEGHYLKILEDATVRFKPAWYGPIMSDDEYNEFEKNYKNFLFNLVNAFKKHEEKRKDRNLEFRKKDEARKNIEKDKNFKETGIRETDFERNLREDEEKVIKEETEGDELIQQYGYIAESYYEDYKSGLIDIEKLRKQLSEMKKKGMLKQDYIDYLLETIEEE